MIRAVFFDLYGTLLVYGNMEKAFHLWHETLALALSTLGRKTTVKEMKRRTKAFFDIEAKGLGAYTPYEERLRILFRTLDVEVSDNWLHRFADSSMDMWQSEISLHKEALTLLKNLNARGVHTGIISNFDHAPYVRRVLKKTRLMPLLKTVILSSEVHVRKPSPLIFQMAVAKANVNAQDVLFVGDDPEYDLKGAQNAGLQAYLHKNKAPLLPILNIL